MAMNVERKGTSESRLSSNMETAMSRPWCLFV